MLLVIKINNRKSDNWLGNQWSITKLTIDLWNWLRNLQTNQQSIASQIKTRQSIIKSIFKDQQLLIELTVESKIATIAQNSILSHLAFHRQMVDSVSSLMDVFPALFSIQGPPIGGQVKGERFTSISLPFSSMWSSLLSTHTLPSSCRPEKCTPHLALAGSLCGNPPSRWNSTSFLSLNKHVNPPVPKVVWISCKNLTLQCTASTV